MDLLVPKERLVCWFPVQIEAKIIKNVAQIGKYHIGKEIIEECKFCTEKNMKQVHELDGDTLH